jgi:cysteinyl-tRNA synthetase
MSFSFTALDGAQTALRRLHRYFVEDLPSHNGTRDETYVQRFLETINDDLDTPKAIALMWELVKDQSVASADKRATMLHFDKALGLGLTELVKSGKEQVSIEVATTDMSELPEEVRLCVERREQARNEKNWQRADELRKEISAHGYDVLDTADGPKVRKNG